MKFKSTLQRAWGRLQTVSAARSPDAPARRTAGSVDGWQPLLSPLQARPPRPVNRLPRANAANLRRFAETPAARRAINCIKDRIASMDWRVEPRPGVSVYSDLAPLAERQAAITRALHSPNASDSFRTLIEPVLEDLLVGGFGAVEMADGTPALPVRLFPVDGATIEIDGQWSGDPDTPRFAQRAPGSVTAEPLRDDELVYIRLNPRTHTVFGLGKLEVAFETISHLLDATRYAARLAGNGTVQYALWLKDRTPEQHERLTRWWQDEVEGSGRVPVLGTEEPPQVVKLAAGGDAELRLQWQEFLLTMIANAFDLPPMMLGVVGSVNRSTAGELADEAFDSAIRPLARLIADHITRDVLGKRLGWDDLRFVWSELDSRDENVELTMQLELLKAGVVSVAEVREMRGLPVLEEANSASPTAAADAPTS